MSLTSCRTVKETSNDFHHRTDTVYVDKVHERTVHDSIYINHRDSIYVNAYIDDDNVRHQDKTKYVYLTKYKYRTDTIHSMRDSIVTVRDTIYVNRIQTITKNESPISRLENVLKTLIALAVCLLIALKWKVLKEFCAKIYAFITQILRHFR